MMIGLRFILGASFLQVQVSEEEAKTIISDWVGGATHRVGGTGQQGSWAVALGAVMAIHTVPLENQAQAQQGKWPTFGGRNLSGI